jgi:2-methylisocitrate lyase-like PEP mutase family enzyme
MLPGAPNAITARVIEETGFEAVYVTGAGIANTFHGVPDIGLVTLSELTAHVAAIREAVKLPLIVDADTGFGNALNVWRTVRDLERAGADSIQIEDQTFPKRCGHFTGQTVIDAAEMVDKIAAACDARRSSSLLITARSDARRTHGLAEACRRANLYREAGADVLFVEAPQTEAEIEFIAKEVEGPKVLNLVQGGSTPILPLERINELGYTFSLYANLPLLASIAGMRQALSHLHARGGSADAPLMATWDERQALVRKAEFDAMSDRYGGAGHSEG